MKKIYIILFLTIALFPLKGFSQDNSITEMSGLSSEIFDFVTQLKTNFDDIVDSEKKSRLYRLLGYLQSDLDQYLTARQSVINELKINDFKIESNTFKNKLSVLKKKLNKISKQLIKISPLVNLEIHSLESISTRMKMNSENAIDGVVQTADNQYVLVLSKLERLAKGESINKDELLENAKDIYTELNKSKNFISEIRCTIKPKRCNNN